MRSMRSSLDDGLYACTGDLTFFNCSSDSHDRRWRFLDGGNTDINAGVDTEVSFREDDRVRLLDGPASDNGWNILSSSLMAVSTSECPACCVVASSAVIWHSLCSGFDETRMRQAPAVFIKERGSGKYSLKKHEALDCKREYTNTIEEMSKFLFVQ